MRHTRLLFISWWGGKSRGSLQRPPDYNKPFIHGSDGSGSRFILPLNISQDKLHLLIWNSLWWGNCCAPVGPNRTRFQQPERRFCEFLLQEPTPSSPESDEAITFSTESSYLVRGSSYWLTKLRRIFAKEFFRMLWNFITPILSLKFLLFNSVAR